MARSSAGGSRYPSAYGHTPSYRSYTSGGMSSVPIDSAYPSALGGGSSSAFGGSSSLSSGLPRSDVFGSTAFGSAGRSALDSFDMGMMPSSSSGGLGGGLSSYGGNTNSGSRVDSKTTVSNYSSTSTDGGRPKVQYSTDNTFRSTQTGNSGIPHTSYAHNSSSYNSEDPYKNRTSNYSYNL